MLSQTIEKLDVNARSWITVVGVNPNMDYLWVHAYVQYRLLYAIDVWPNKHYTFHISCLLPLTMSMSEDVEQLATICDGWLTARIFVGSCWMMLDSLARTTVLIS